MAAPRSDAWPSIRLRLLVLAALVLLAMNLRGAVTSVPPVLNDVSSAVGLSAAEIGVLGALPALAFALAGLVGARLLRRVAAERVALGVLLIAGTVQLSRPWLGEVAGAVPFLTVSAIALLAMGVGNVLLPAVVKAWFPRRIGPVTGAYVTAITIGTSIPALLSVPLSRAFPDVGWRMSLATWGAVALTVLPIWLVPAFRPRAVPGAVPSGGRVRLPLYRSRIAWGITLVFGMNALNTYAMLTWLPVRLTDAGLSAGKAGAELALYAGCGTPLALLLPMVVTRMRRPSLLITACVTSFAIGYAGLLLAPDRLTSLWVALSGLGGLGFPISLTLVGLRSASHTTAGALSGFAQGIGYAMAAAGPLTVGILHDTVGGWTAPFAFLGSTLILMLVGGRLAAPARHVEDDLHRAHSRNVDVTKLPADADTLEG